MRLSPSTRGRSGRKPNTEAVAVRISLQIARAIAPYTDGFYLMTPFRRVELVSAILRQIRAGGL